jgi:hypothetical protein
MPRARRKVCAPPAVEPNLNGTSVRIGKIKIDAARMLSDAILTPAPAHQIGRAPRAVPTRSPPRPPQLRSPGSSRPQIGSETFAANGPCFSVAVGYKIGVCEGRTVRGPVRGVSIADRGERRLKTLLDYFGVCGKRVLGRQIAMRPSGRLIRRIDSQG